MKNGTRNFMEKKLGNVSRKKILKRVFFFEIESGPHRSDSRVVPKWGLCEHGDGHKTGSLLIFLYLAS
jgi:hypothetical protein